MYGPFSTEAKATQGAARITAAQGHVTSADFEDLNYEELQAFLVNHLWLIQEVEFFNEDDEELLDMTARTTPHILVEDDGSVHGPFETYEDALHGGIALLLGDELTVQAYRNQANHLLETFQDRGPAALDLIHEVDWIVTTEAVYAVEQVSGLADAVTI